MVRKVFTICRKICMIWYFLDRMLPSMDGTQVLKEARQSNISTPVIFLTALGELQDKVNGLNCGADDYMVKPFAFVRASCKNPQHYAPSRKMG